MDVLQKIYDSEINVRIEWQWDGGIEWSIVAGYDNKDVLHSGNEKTIEKAIKALTDKVCEKYPESDFAICFSPKQE